MASIKRDIVRIAKIYIILLLLSFGILKTYAESADTLLSKYGLSSDYFEIVLVKDASKNVFRNLSSDALKPTDTIIIAKVDTFQNILNIKGKSLNHRLVLSGKVFKKGISFHSSRFKKEVYLNECEFFDRADFSKAIFDSTLILWRTKFKKAGVFNNATFNGLQFRDTQFDEDVQFHEVQFNRPTFFISTKFKKGAYFVGATFNDFASFNFSEFEQRPWFWQSMSRDTLTFYSVKLKNGIDFQSSNLGQFLGLNHLESGGKIDFSDVSMPTFTDLSSLKTEWAIDFNYINDSNKTNSYNINIYDVDVSKLILTKQFNLYFDEYLSLDIKNSIYKQLLDNLNSKGYKDVYKSFDIKYKGFVNSNYNNYSEKIVYMISRLWWNFGYNKHRVFLWTIIFIILFSIPIRIWLNLFVDKTYNYQKLSLRYSANRQIKSAVKRFLYDYWIALIYTTFVFFNLKLDLDKLSFDRFRASSFILFIYVIGLICSAFIVNLIITI